MRSDMFSIRDFPLWAPGGPTWVAVAFTFGHPGQSNRVQLERRTNKSTLHTRCLLRLQQWYHHGMMGKASYFNLMLSLPVTKDLGTPIGRSTVVWWLKPQPLELDVQSFNQMVIPPFGTLNKLSNFSIPQFLHPYNGHYNNIYLIGILGTLFEIIHEKARSPLFGL